MTVHVSGIAAAAVMSTDYRCKDVSIHYLEGDKWPVGVVAAKCRLPLVALVLCNKCYFPAGH